MDKKSKPKTDEYYLIVDDEGCCTCGHERTWMIIDPKGHGGGTSWGDREFADDLVDMLNDAYRLGKENPQP